MSNSTISTPKQKADLYLASSLRDGLEDNNLGQIRTLLENKDADPNVLMPLHGVTPFHLAIGNDSISFAEEVTKLFLRHKANPNVKSVDGMTPVHVAAAWGRSNILELLLANGGDPFSEDDDKCTPLHYAFQGGHAKCINILKNYCNIELSKDEENSKPKYKLELDKILFKNGDVLAEYIASTEIPMESTPSDELSFKTCYTPNGNYNGGSSDITSDLTSVSNYISNSKYKRHITQQNKSVKNSFESSKAPELENQKNEEEEANLNEGIIFQTSIDDLCTNSPTKYQCDKNIYKCRYISSPVRRKEIKMTFNRPVRKQPKSNKTLFPNSKKITANIMEHQNNYTTSKSDKLSPQVNKFVKKTGMIYNAKNKLPSPYLNKSKDVSEFIDETIISRSPNLYFSIDPITKKPLKVSTFEKKLSPLPGKVPKKLQKTSKSRTPRKCNLYQETPKKISKSRKYFNTPKSIKTKKNCDNKNSQAKKNTGQQEDQSFVKLAKSLFEVNENEEIYTSKSGLFKHLEDSDIDNSSPNFISGIHRFEDATGFITKSLQLEPNQSVSAEHFEEIVGLHSCSSFSQLSDCSHQRTLSISRKDSENKSLKFNSSLNCCQGSLSSNSLSNLLSDTETNQNGEQTDSIHSSLSKNNSLLSDQFDNETIISIEEEYKYQDLEEGINLLERRLCITPSCASSNSSFYSCTTTRSEPIPIEILKLDNITLRERLISYGDNPGPITKTTQQLYLKRLHKLETQKKLTKKSSPINKSPCLNKEKNLIPTSLLSVNWVKDIDEFQAFEQKVFREFNNPDPTRKWREGNSKNSFNYFLLDPRITKDLPRRAVNLSLSEKWEIFLSAIFYVGKGKRSRPYAHLYDAFKVWISDNKKSDNKKISRILDIWKMGVGVVVLHVFQNTIPVEAYTREAVIIETLSPKKLSNCNKGECYGVGATLRSKERFELGRYLLFKAMQIFLLEGERQISPNNL